MNTELHRFQRYRPLIDDWSAFAAAMARPLPQCIWTHSLRATPSELAELASNAGLQTEPIGWIPGAFRLAADGKTGNQWWYLAGLCHTQEEVSMLPVHLLEPKPGHRVLDLCAAPGGKTAQIALALGNRGTVIANDASVERMRPLRATIERLGLVNITTTKCNGANFPSSAGLFDRVLVDAPCTGEGTWRKTTRHGGASGAAVSLERSRLQKALLRRGVELCRLGGRIVYSTCTFAPEENEMVVDAILREFGGQVEVVAAKVQGFTTFPGATEWNGQALTPSLANTLRVWPHSNDTGGFYIAVLQKTGSPKQQPLRSPDVLAFVPDHVWKPQLTERFGCELENGLAAHRQTTRGFHLLPMDHTPLTRPEADASGLFFLRTNVNMPKLTTAGAMLIGASAERNAIELEYPQAAAYLARRAFRVAGDQAQAADDGYVVLRHRGHTLGIGLYKKATGGVASLYPKHWATEI